MLYERKFNFVLCHIFAFSWPCPAAKKKNMYKLEDCFLSSNITFEFGKKDENALKSSLFQTSSFV